MKYKYDIGGLVLENPLALSPLAGITISPVRRMMRRMGCSMTHTEMISCSGLVYGALRTLEMLSYSPEERPISMQVFAGDVETLLKGVGISLEHFSFDALNINMACPMPKVVKKGAGSALMRDPEKACAMVKALKNFGLGIPVWVKIRKNPPNYSCDTVTFAHKLEDSGADLVAVHGRTPAQRYTGKADKSVIEDCVKNLNVPVAASGDVFTEEDVLYYHNQLGARLILIARGFMRDPFFPSRALVSLGLPFNERYIEPDFNVRVDEIISLGRDITELLGKRVGSVMIKRFLSGFLKASPGIAHLKHSLMQVTEWDEMEVAISRYRDYVISLDDRGRGEYYDKCQHEGTIYSGE